MLLLLVLPACVEAPIMQEELVTVHLHTATAPTRSANPPENAVDDVNLFVFGPEGHLERHVWLNRSAEDINITLLKDVPYTYYVCANLGYRLEVSTVRELEGSRYFLTYPDEFSRGIPMTAVLRDAVAGEDGGVDLELKRCMARLELMMDRTALYSGVEINVESIEVGACPRSVALFSESRVRSREDLFAKGYMKDGLQVRSLNTAGGAVSEPVYLYMLENCQGTLLEDASGPEDKVFGSLDPRGELCSWIEIRASYKSSRYHTKPGEYLIYRFYLGESPCNFDVRRNVTYPIVVRPEGSGLNENSWRVDRSAIEAN